VTQSTEKPSLTEDSDELARDYDRVSVDRQFQSGKMLVRELAKTFGRYGIRVNALVPGAIAAGGFVADPKLARHIPLGRLGAAEDLAPMALAVLSNRISAYVTGAAIVVDGGLSLTNWFEPPELEDL